MTIIESHATRALLGAVLLASSGCSFTFVHPPSSSGSAAGPRRACTSSKLAPVLDTIFTGAQVVRTAYALSASDSVYDDPTQPLSRGADVGLGVGFAALFLSSAVYGYVNTSECSKRGQGPSDAAGAATEDDDLSTETWTSPPHRKPGAAAKQPVEPAASPSPPGSDAEPAPSVEPSESDPPADAPPSPPPPAPSVTGS
jgi:hypothetical protein